jgi:DnaJ-class molecular chaperone
MELTLYLLALAVAAGYVLACACWPFRPCRRCLGTGTRRSPSGKAWRPCSRCDGTGTQVRVGRRIYEVFHRSDERP